MHYKGCSQKECTTLRRKSIGLFAHFSYEIVIFESLENCPNNMQTFFFHQLIGPIGKPSDEVMVIKFPVFLKIRAVKIGPFYFHLIKQVFFLHFQIWQVVKSESVKIFEPKLIETLFTSMQEVIDEKMRKFASFR